MFIYALSIMGGTGLVLGFILGFAAFKLQVIEDPLVAQLTTLLPGINCGGCGYAGCEAFANGIVDGDVKKISQCRPSNDEQRSSISELLKNTPNQKGEFIDIKI